MLVRGVPWLILQVSYVPIRYLSLLETRSWAYVKLHTWIPLEILHFINVTVCISIPPATVDLGYAPIHILSPHEISHPVLVQLLVLGAFGDWHPTSTNGQISF